MRLIVFLLKCVVGLLASLGFIIVAGAAALYYFGSQVPEVKKLTGAKQVPAQTLLVLDLSDGLSEDGPRDSLLDFARFAKRPLVLSDAVQALRRAADDPKVLGLVARLGRGPLGLAQTEELRGAILEFRNSGKTAVAFAETFGEAGPAMPHYYLASAFESLWVQPSASLPITGFRLEQPYLAGALDSIGILPRFDQREEYKGAGSTLTEREQPEAVRENLTDLVTSLLEVTLQDVAAVRNIEPQRLRALIDSAPLTAAQALEAGLVDRLGYLDQAEAEVERAIGTEEASRLDLRRYAALTREEPLPGAARIALIKGQGAIVLESPETSPLSGRQNITPERMAGALSDAIEDPDIKAIVLRVDSPGGSYVASDAIWRQVVRAREAGKPVVVSMGNLAASGGYFIAMAANKIVAQPMTITGSIGVVAGKFVIEDLLDELEISLDAVQAGENAGFFASTQDFTPEQWELFQALLDRTYADFTAKAAAGRGLSAEQIEAVAGGRVWSGTDAREAGLVDALGGLQTAVELAKSEAGIDAATPVALIPFPEERDPFKAILEDALGQPLTSLARLERLLGQWLYLAEELERSPQSRILEDRRFSKPVD